MGLCFQLVNPIRGADIGAVGNGQDDGAAEEQAGGSAGHRWAQHRLRAFGGQAGEGRGDTGWKESLTAASEEQKRGRRGVTYRVLSALLRTRYIS